MKGNKHTPEQIVAKLRQAAGTRVPTCVETSSSHVDIPGEGKSA
jgi:hypothetical protein